MEPFSVVIPARYGSTRLPGKPLLDIAGKPLIQHVCERAALSGAEAVIVATDDARIVDACKQFDIEAVMTSRMHASGTDRVAEVTQLKGIDKEHIIVNVQGDEPLISPKCIAQVAKNLAENAPVDMTTLYEPIKNQGELNDPSVVKVVTDLKGIALYFSRAPIPWYRDAFAAGESRAQDLHRRHLGIYGYRTKFVQRFVSLGTTQIEVAEALEQLRAQYHGARIHVDQAVEPSGPGVDTLADLERIRGALAG